jgi:hypothetical protein
MPERMPIGDVGNRSDGGIVEAPFKPYCAERGKAVRDSDKSNLTSKAALNRAFRQPF